MEKFTFKASIDALEERVAILEATVAALIEAADTTNANEEEVE